LPIAHAANAAARTTFVNVYVCPSDTSPRLIRMTDSGNPPADANVPVLLAEASVCSYAGVLGDGAYEQLPFTGVFHRNSRIRFADITDGTSTLPLLGEQLGRRHSGAGNRLRADGAGIRPGAAQPQGSAGHHRRARPRPHHVGSAQRAGQQPGQLRLQPHRRHPVRQHGRLVPHDLRFRDQGDLSGVSHAQWRRGD